MLKYTFKKIQMQAQKKTNAVPLNTLVEQFYKSLSKPERMAHEIAARPGSEGGLGSSYIVERTPAYIKWMKKQQEQMPQSSVPK
jgi:hypothetical protein